MKKIVYHATKKSFDPDKPKTPLFLADDPEWVKPWGSIVLKYDLTLVNPMVLKNEGMHHEFLDDPDEILNIQKKGHDGVVIENDGRPTIYLAFEPYQLHFIGKYEVKPEHREAFDRWFAGSKVVNDKGEPLVVYHGTTAADFKVFKHVDQARDFETGKIVNWRRPLWFSDNFSYSRGLVGKSGKVRAFYLSIKKPLDMRSLGEMATYEEIKAFYKAKKLKIRPKHDWGDRPTPVFDEPKMNIEAIEKAGYDGVILKESGGSISYVAFHPGQVKSATDNKGSFDMNSDDISEQILAEVRSRVGGWYGPLYHGSRYKFLKELDPKMAGSGVVSYGARGPVTWFTSSKDNAEFYTDPGHEDDNVQEYVYTAYVKMQNPLIVDVENEINGSPALWLDEAKNEGHDGLIVKNVIDGTHKSDVYAVWTKKNIRLVGPLQPPKLRHDVEIDEDDIEVLGKAGMFYAFIRDVDDEMVMNVGPFKTEAEAEAEAQKIIADRVPVPATMDENAGAKIPTFEEAWTRLSEVSESIDEAERELLKDGVSQDEVEQEVEDWGRSRYETAVEMIQGSNGARCWRGMTIPHDQDPAQLKNVGRYWSLSRSGAKAYYGKDDDRNVVFQGVVNLANVDWMQTIVARMNFISGDDEDEIAFLPGKQIKITGFFDEQDKRTKIDTFMLTNGLEDVTEGRLDSPTRKVMQAVAKVLAEKLPLLSKEQPHFTVELTREKDGIPVGSLSFSFEYDPRAPMVPRSGKEIEGVFNPYADVIMFVVALKPGAKISRVLTALYEPVAHELDHALDRNEHPEEDRQSLTSALGYLIRLDEREQVVAGLYQEAKKTRKPFIKLLRRKIEDARKTEVREGMDEGASRKLAAHVEKILVDTAKRRFPTAQTEA